jgi:hypothetical protein
VLLLILRLMQHLMILQEGLHGMSAEHVLFDKLTQSRPVHLTRDTQLAHAGTRELGRTRFVWFVLHNHVTIKV